MVVNLSILNHQVLQVGVLKECYLKYMTDGPCCHRQGDFVLSSRPGCSKLTRLSWVHVPSAVAVAAPVVVSCFLVTGGIIYNVVIEPLSVGSATDEHGPQRPVAFWTYKVNGEYIMEGLACSFLFTMGGLGFIILD